jgi:SAM-dependent methyltransferase
VKLGSMLRRAPTTIRNAVLDLRYGGLLGGTITTRQAHLGAHDVGNADYDDLTELFAQIEIVPDDVIVDVGCGKGRAINWFLAHHGQNRIYGIELDPEVCARTAKRLRRRANVTILCGDATELLPADGTLFYLFNPFDESVMRRFAHAFAEGAGGRPRTIAYYNCKYLDVFGGDERFEVRELDRPRSFRSAVIRLP